MSCPVCFSGGEGPMVNGSNMAIVTLLGVTVSMLVGVAAVILSIARRIDRLGSHHEGTKTRRSVFGFVSSCFRDLVIAAKFQ